MARHKKIAFYDGDWEELFPSLRKKKMVLEQYEYSNHKVVPGTVFVAKEAGETFISIASNFTKTYSRGYGRRRQYNRYRIMYHLTEEGWDYLQEVMVDEALAEC